MSAGTEWKMQNYDYFSHFANKQVQKASSDSRFFFAKMWVRSTTLTKKCLIAHFWLIIPVDSITILFRNEQPLDLQFVRPRSIEADRISHEIVKIPQALQLKVSPNYSEELFLITPFKR